MFLPVSIIILYYHTLKNEVKHAPSKRRDDKISSFWPIKKIKDWPKDEHHRKAFLDTLARNF